jgi:hypothetical protein
VPNGAEIDADQPQTFTGSLTMRTTSFSSTFAIFAGAEKHDFTGF